MYGKDVPGRNTIVPTAISFIEAASSLPVLAIADAKNASAC
jgi:hypothetical protein